MDLEVAGTDGHVEAVSVAACRVQRPGHRRLAHAVKAKRPPLAVPCAREDIADGRGLQRGGPEPLELAGWAGEHDHGRALGLQHEARSGAGQADRHRACRERRLLAHAVCEVGVRPAEAFRKRPRDRFDLRFEGSIDDELGARGPRDHLHRSVVVSGAQPPGYNAEIGLEALAERGLELFWSVADDRYARGIEPERQHGVREKRPVAIVAVSSHELAPGGNDRHSRACHGVRPP